jgi:hypothetical protein
MKDSKYARMHRKALARKHVDRKLLFRLRMFLAISFIMLLIIIYDVIQNVINPALAVLGIGAGLILGLFLSRIFRIAWHEERKQVISNLDRVGTAILVIYMIFSFLRCQLLSQWIHGPELSAFIFALIGGVMFGRFMAMNFHVQKILSANVGF